MVRIIKRFIGRPNEFYGKTLAEIVKQLRGFGVGRIVARNSILHQYPTQPSFYLLTRVAPKMQNAEQEECRAWGLQIYRGINCGENEIDRPYLSDWRLIHKHEENALLSHIGHAWYSADKVRLPSTRTYPPLLEALTFGQTSRFNSHNPVSSTQSPHSATQPNKPSQKSTSVADTGSAPSPSPLLYLYYHAREQRRADEELHAGPYETHEPLAYSGPHELTPVERTWIYPPLAEQLEISLETRLQMEDMIDAWLDTSRWRCEKLKKMVNKFNSRPWPPRIHNIE